MGDYFDDFLQGGGVTGHSCGGGTGGTGGTGQARNRCLQGRGLGKTVLFMADLDKRGLK